MSDTPRTDAAPNCWRYRSRATGMMYTLRDAAGECEAIEYVDADFARQLERELNECKKMFVDSQYRNTRFNHLGLGKACGFCGKDHSDLFESHACAIETAYNMKSKLAEAEKLLKSCRTAMSIDYRDNYKRGLVTGDCAFTDWTRLIAAIDAAMKQETKQ